MGPEQTRRTYRGERLHGVTDVQHGARAGACTRRGAAVWRGEAWVWVAGGRGLQCWPRGGVQPAGETPWLACGSRGCSGTCGLFAGIFLLPQFCQPAAANNKTGGPPLSLMPIHHVQAGLGLPTDVSDRTTEACGEGRRTGPAPAPQLSHTWLPRRHRPREAQGAHRPPPLSTGGPARSP